MAWVTAVAGRAVRLRGGFWGAWEERLRTRVLPYQWRVLCDEEPGIEPPSHALRNLRRAAGEGPDDGAGYLGRYHTDTDLAKWLEAAAYLLERAPEPALDAAAETIVSLAAKGQWPDGYLNSRTTLDPERRRWRSLRRDHELYAAGHWLEALVAYHAASGSTLALETAVRLGDCLTTDFGPGSPRPEAYPDHPETELALVRLWRATGREAYLELARHFVYERGLAPVFGREAERDGEPRRYDETYSLSDRPLLEQPVAQGHAVRAMYLYAGAADVLAARPDPALVEALDRLWLDVTSRQMFVTGAVGSDGEGERFTIGYDLPPDRAYAETCASAGLILWARRMLALKGDARYADVIERAFYNGLLSGVSLDGERYFYVNPLEVWPAQAAARHDLIDVARVRQAWFECACCPPNLARLLASVADDLYGLGADGESVYVHQFAASEARVPLQGGEEVRLSQRGDYPWAGEIAVRVEAAPGRPWRLALRRPGWARGFGVRVNGEGVDVAPAADGYLHIERAWRPGDEVTVALDLPVERVSAHPLAWGLGGRVALMRGPLVYCLEEADNGPGLAALSVVAGEGWGPAPAPDLLGGVVVLRGPVARRLAAADGALYSADRLGVAMEGATAVPYMLWGNRGEGEMAVWLPER